MSFGRWSGSLFLGIVLLTVVRPAHAKAVCEVVHLRCEHLENPLGIDGERPQLSWQLDDARRGARQTAYRVLVASKSELLSEGKADLWDSGKVDSDRSALVPYGGKPLGSRQRVWWQARVWDKDGKPSAYSAPARWEMGLLKPDDWRAQWIGMVDQTAGASPDVSAIRWIWFPEGDPHIEGPAKATRYFRTVFDLPANQPVARAMLYGAADNSFVAMVNGKRVSGGGGWNAWSSVDVKDQLVAGRNVLAVSAFNDSGPAGLAALLDIRFANGNKQLIPTGGSWRTANAMARGWTAAGFDDSGWKQAAEVAKMGEPPWGTPVAPAIGGPAPMLRKSFSLSKPVATARVYVTALGSYRLHINGGRVGNDILTPDWTDYRKRVSYQTYNVTKLLKRGDNAMGVLLGDGWYASGLGWALQRNCFGPPPSRLLLQMHIRYADGSEEVIVSDSTWKAARSPILRSEIYAGETYDARLEQPGWDRAGFNDHAWKPVETFGGVDQTVYMHISPGSELSFAAANRDESAKQPAPSRSERMQIPGRIALTAQRSPTIQITEAIKPKAITNPAPGVYVYDMGQNMVGWAQLRVNGAAGTTVRMRFAEILKPDGNIYTENLRKAEATDTYTMRGGGTEVFEPHFTYHGFRFVEVTGYPGKPGLDSITGQVFHTNAPVAGTLTTSSEMVNRLVRNIDWGMRGNLESVPTDCPQRDERLGWMGDAQIIWLTATYLHDMAAFTHKWTADVREAQSPEGGYSDVSPRVIDAADGAPAWGDAGIVVPWTGWRQYGDTKIVTENWDAMEKWMDYIHSANPDLLWLKRRNNDFGDWVPANSETPKDLIATAYWALDARMMAQMAHAVGNESAAKKYADLYGGIKSAFIRRFVREDGTVGNGSQTCYALALHMDLLPDDRRAEAVKKLVADIESRGGHLSTGFIGTAYLMPALTQNGANDVAYRLLLNDTYPSWGYMIKKGATTIWERWNGDTGDPGMNSFNHYAFGAVGEWLYRFAGGIDTDPSAPGFKRIVIRPRPGPGLTHVHAEHDSPYGKIVSEWDKSSDALVLSCTIPANTTAAIYVPASDASHVMENGVAIAPDSSVKFLRMEDGCAVYEAGAGKYRFSAR